MDLLNAFVALANFVLIPATAYGAQLALGALGVTLIYGILRFSNFAHGDTMAFGTMVVVIVTWWLQSLGLSLGPLPTALLAIPFGIAATAVLVLVTDRDGLPVLPPTKGQTGDPGDCLHRGDVHLQRADTGDPGAGRPALHRWRTLHHFGAAVPRL
jgi:hypothetical protein